MDMDMDMDMGMDMCMCMHMHITCTCARAVVGRKYGCLARGYSAKNDCYSIRVIAMPFPHNASP